MPIKLRCKSCRAVLRTKNAMAGKTAKCPHCEGRVRIPVPKPQREEIFDAEEVGGDEDFDFGGYDLNAGISMPSDDRKPCPACGEMIVRKAAKCRYCGEIFDPALKRRKKRSRRRRRSRYSDDEELETLEWLVVIFLGGIACIMGIIYLCQGRTSKGAKMIAYPILIRIVLGFFFFLFVLVAEGLQN